MNRIDLGSTNDSHLIVFFVFQYRRLFVTLSCFFLFNQDLCLIHFDADFNFFNQCIIQIDWNGRCVKIIKAASIIIGKGSAADFVPRLTDPPSPFSTLVAISESLDKLIGKIFLSSGLYFISAIYYCPFSRFFWSKSAFKSSELVGKSVKAGILFNSWILVAVLVLDRINWCYPLFLQIFILNPQTFSQISVHFW